MMIEKKRLLILLIITIICSFLGGMYLYYLIEKKEVVITANQPKRSITQIKREVYNGNEHAYGELRTIYMDYPEEDFLFWALLMANKYQDKDASTDVYRIIEKIYFLENEKIEVELMDSLTKKMFIQYLTLSSMNDDSTAISILKTFKK